MKLNARNKIGGITLLAEIEDATARLAFFDPQYRSQLDRLAYGNEGNDGSRQKARARLPQMRDNTIELFAYELLRALKPSGHLMLWVDKFTVAEHVWDRWMPSRVALPLVDLQHWNKARTGMGKRTRCRSEYLLIFQKPPVRAKGIWTDHRLDDSWIEQSDRSVHPHAKPLALIQRLIRATTKPGDLVLDPAAGGYGVLEACRATGRNFMGCDIVTPEEE